MTTIVAAIDSSPAARAVVSRALDYARRAGSTLHVIHVFHPPTAIYTMAGTYVFEEEELAQSERDAVWDNVTDLLQGSDIEWMRKDMRGYPPTTIAEYAAEVDADLIVVGTRGRGGFSALVLGSTSQGVIHEAGCDVLVVKSGGE